MARISYFPTPPFVLAVGLLERPQLAPGEPNHGFTLTIDGIQDSGNVGTLLRMADWLGLDRVLLSPVATICLPRRSLAPAWARLPARACSPRSSPRP